MNCLNTKIFSKFRLEWDVYKEHSCSKEENPWQFYHINTDPYLILQKQGVTKIPRPNSKARIQQLSIITCEIIVLLVPLHRGMRKPAAEGKEISDTQQRHNHLTWWVISLSLSLPPAPRNAAIAIPATSSPAELPSVPSLLHRTEQKKLKGFSACIKGLLQSRWFQCPEWCVQLHKNPWKRCTFSAGIRSPASPPVHYSHVSVCSALEELNRTTV